MSRYNDKVSEFFMRPPVSGGESLSGEAGSVGAGTRISLSADLDAGKLKNVGFRVFGCPHIIALAHRVTGLLEGAPAESLRDLPLEDLAREFNFPVEKTGKLLIMKDALAAALAACEAGVADAANNQARN